MVMTLSHRGVGVLWIHHRYFYLRGVHSCGARSHGRRRGKMESVLIHAVCAVRVLRLTPEGRRTCSAACGRMHAPRSLLAPAPCV